MYTLHLENWTINNQQLYRKISLPNFKIVMLYANEIAELAENMNHHPRLVIAFDLLEIYLYTFDQQAITDLDYELAQKIELILSSPLPQSN
jgi:4a-hydroxytetrahydrobiopterin dehydratase